MANIKFSQFTVETAKADVDFLVGYSGPDNVQISTTNLLADYPTGSGTTGQVTFFSAASTVTGDNDFYWDNTNKRLGIGTTSPDYNLHVKKSGTNSAITIEGSTNSGANFSSRLNFSNKDISGNDIDFSIGLKKSNNFVFMGDAAANELMRIEGNTGDVGIGTATPVAKLQVEGSFISSGISQLGTTGANVLLTSSSAGNVGIGDSSPTAKLVVNNVGTKMLELKRSGNIKFRVLADANHGQLNMFNSGASNTVRLHTNGDSYFNGGNVGIGTTTPDKKLDITVDTSDDGVILQTVSGRKALEAFVDNGANGQGKIHFYTGANLLHGRIMADSAGLNITQLAADKDISFKADDGSGGTTEYFRIDGGFGSPQTIFPDDSQLSFGNGLDLRIVHDGSLNKISSNNHDFRIIQNLADGDMSFYADNGSGGTTEYMRIDGGENRIIYSQDGRHLDNVKSMYGSGADFQIVHNGTDTQLNNLTGNLQFTQLADDKDISFASDNGSGGDTIYFYLDGSSTQVKYDVNLKIHDSKKLIIGDGDDLQIQHASGTNIIDSAVGDLIIKVSQDNGDIIFQSDNGSGAIDTYYRIDGGVERNIFSKSLRLLDDVKLDIGSSDDFRIIHTSANNTSFIQNFTGDLQIQNNSNGDDILFRCDDGSGGLTTYFYLDGGQTNVNFQKDALFADNKKALFGGSGDLQIYHTGSSSIIGEFGPGNLSVRGDNLQLHRADGSQRYFQGITGGAATMYHAGNPKLETTSTGTKTTGQMNIAALNTPVTNSDDNGTIGEIRFTADYIYVCVADDTWKRVALSTW